MSVQTETAGAAKGTACCVCGETQARQWRKSGDNLLGGPEIYTAVKCVTCGTVRLFPRPDANTMRRAYSPQTYARAENGTGKNPGLAKRLDVFFDHQAQRANTAFERFAAPTVPRRVLDVGCGDGRFLQAMQKRGWDGVGLETDAHAAALARKRAATLPVYETTLETADLPPASFGMVSLLHVLEHVPDPRETLGGCYEMLAPGGLLLLALPNAQSMEANIFGANWYQLDLPRHFWGFGPQNLVRLAIETGFTNPTLRFLPFFFGPQSLRNVLRSARGRSLADTPPFAPGPALPASESPAKTRAFLALLAASETMGHFVPGEVMELVAIRPVSPVK